MSKALDEEDFKLASNSRFFKGLSDEDIAILLQNAVVSEEEKSTLLFSQGDPANRFYILLEGRVKLFTANEEGKKVLLKFSTRSPALQKQPCLLLGVFR